LSSKVTTYDLCKDYESVITQFTDNIYSIKTFVDYIKPTLERRKEEFYNNNSSVLNLVFRLSDLESPDKFKPEEYEKLIALKSQLENNFGFSFESIKNESKINITMNNGLMKDIFVKKLEEHKVLSSQISILYQSCFINLVVFFELLISSLLRIRINSNPESFNIKDKSLKFDEIRKLGTLEHAEEYLIENEIESIMRGSFDSWCTYFKKNLKRDFAFLTELEDDLTEIIQRRNLLVHNGCIANRIYFSNVAEKFKKDISIGDNLTIELDYLESSLIILEKVGLLIGLDIWQNSNKNSSKRFSFVERIAFDYMKSNKWDTALALYDFSLKEKGVSNKIMCIFSVNRWLCYKSLGLYDHIKPELEKVDFSDKSLDLQLAVLALKGDAATFFKKLPMAYPSLIDLYSLLTWPILKEIRTTKEYKQFVDSCPDYEMIKEMIITSKEVAVTNEMI
jgi:hypothetical protein